MHHAKRDAEIRGLRYEIRENANAFLVSLISCLISLHHIPCDASVWALPCSLAATNEMSFLRTLFSFPPGTEMFYFPGCALYIICRVTAKAVGFPHSEISGSKVARYLPETYRHHAASFIAF